MGETVPESAFAWIALKRVPGIGAITYKRLLERFSTPEKVLGASAESLVRTGGIPERLAKRIESRKGDDWVGKEIRRAQAGGFAIVTYLDEAYPPPLRRIPDPPPYLYVSGSVDPRADHIAVVGSRTPTAYGLTNARGLARDLVSLGFVVVSGMARGIDSAAHAGALEAGGKTVAVLGSGLERIYPPENAALFREISKNGAVVSEFPLQSRPEAFHFPARNRIISGISLGVVVVEAAKKSGSLITARLAAEQNREVFAVPGSVRSYKSAGTHNLIRQGAKLVEHSRDIVEELAPQTGRLESPGDDCYYGSGSKPKVDLNPEERAVLDRLEPYPIHIDELARKTSINPGKISGILLKLELEGLVEQLPGKCFCLKIRG